MAHIPTIFAWVVPAVTEDAAEVVMTLAILSVLVVVTMVNSVFINKG
jgi:hypothetical protein